MAISLWRGRCTTKDSRRRRDPTLIIVVMSATLDVGPLRKYLEPCEVLSSQGRTFPVDIDYLPKPVGDWPIWEAAVKELERLVAQHEGRR